MLTNYAYLFPDMWNAFSQKIIRLISLNYMQNYLMFDSTINTSEMPNAKCPSNWF